MNEDKDIGPKALPKIRTMQSDMGIASDPMPEKINIETTPKKELDAVSVMPKIESVPAPISVQPIEQPINNIPEQPFVSPKINELSRMPAPLPRNEPVPVQARAPQSLRTFSDDLSSALRRTQGSIITIALQEEEKRNQMKPVAKRKDSFLVVISIGLITIALGAIFFVLSGKELPFTEPTDVSTVSEKLLLPITVNNIKSISLDGKTRDSALSEVSTLLETTETGITGIIFTKTFGESNKLLSTTEFTSFFEIKTPGALARGFDSSFLFGTFKNEDTSPFFIFTAESFESALSGMLAWEENIVTDLYLFLNIKRESLGDQNFVFEDSVIENKDVRILTLPTGENIFYLVYPDGTIFIATDKNIVGEVTEKISIEKLK
jgi:hypothetical protein